jgi:hypothetical protein
MKLPTDPITNADAATMPFTFTCPSLGMADDRTTVTLFPSQDNLCFHCQSPTAPNAAHQSSYCLSQKFMECTLKQQDGHGNLPAESRWPTQRSGLLAVRRRTAWALGIALLLALFFILWLPGILSDMMMNFAPTPVSGGTWPTLTPAALEPATPTSTPAPLNLTLTVAWVDLGVNCRAGPDTSYTSLILLLGGEALEPLGRDETDTFFVVSIPGKNISECWIVQSLVVVEGDPSALPILTPSPAP